MKETTDGQWKITKVDSIGWAAQRKVETGDIITEINGKNPESFHFIKQYGVVGHLDQMKVLRNGSLLEFEVQVPRNYNTLLYHTLLPLLAFLVLFGFSVYIYCKKRDNKVVFILVAFFIAVGLCYVSAGASARTDSFARIMNSLSMMMVPALFIHFHYRYFFKYQIQFMKMKYLVIIYVVNLLVVLLGMLSIFVYVGNMYVFFRNAQLLLFSFEILLSFVVLIYHYFKYRKMVQKPILQNAIFGIVVSFFPFIFLTALPNTIFGVELIPASLTAACLIFLPVFFLYLVIMDQVFDIDFINSRLRYYAFISLILTGIIIGIMLFFTNLSFIEWARVTILTYGSLIIIFYLEEKFNIRHRLFKDKFNLDRYSYDIAKIVKREELDKRLIKEIREVLPIQKVSLIKFDKKGVNTELSAGDNIYPEGLIEIYIKYYNPMISIGSQFSIEGGLCYIISEQHDSIHVLWIQRKANFTPFNRDEQSWLKMLVHYTSIVYENFQLIEGVTEDMKQSLDNDQAMPPWMLRLLFRLSEKERTRLSSDLHDSALQEQLVWYRKVEELLEEDQLPDSVRAPLTDMRQGLLGVVEQIRETCTLLRPPFLKETGIIEALSYLIQQYRSRESFAIEFISHDFKVNLEDDQALVIYRVVQELLNNASKHSGASQIVIEMKSEGNAVFLTYKDDGVGFPPNTSYHSGKHMGLVGIRQRVNSIRGNMEVFSSENTGVEVAILLETDLEIRHYSDVM
ncbi:histidine kinase [Gracilibacillus caseinilyticus]|uniref:histidine kinase n=1 Tax=Gracilibacillus caseinilyticus TaxID=2932256 RepID=A0ABY4EYN4_9BACI|nr:ATP-binding protein [Gracilibacillus caseinilyticus]UOQ49126.1 histidine kinase [Gracilibacillus caseinilyticus]